VLAVGREAGKADGMKGRCADAARFAGTEGI
jgi:hypothetical protein